MQHTTALSVVYTHSAIAISAGAPRLPVATDTWRIESGQLVGQLQVTADWRALTTRTAPDIFALADHVLGQAGGVGAESTTPHIIRAAPTNGTCALKRLANDKIRLDDTVVRTLRSAASETITCGRRILLSPEYQESGAQYILGAAGLNSQALAALLNHISGTTVYSGRCATKGITPTEVVSTLEGVWNNNRDSTTTPYPIQASTTFHSFEEARAAWPKTPARQVDGRSITSQTEIKPNEEPEASEFFEDIKHMLEDHKRKVSQYDSAASFTYLRIFGHPELAELRMLVRTGDYAVIGLHLVTNGFAQPPFMSAEQWDKFGSFVMNG